jgi:hypothetical protein
MRLYEEILRGVFGDSAAKYTVCVGGGGYFQGVKSVGDFSPTLLMLHYPRAQLRVQGEKLCIRKYCEGDLEISGNIYAVELVLPEQKENANGDNA